MENHLGLRVDSRNCDQSSSSETIFRQERVRFRLESLWTVSIYPSLPKILEPTLNLDVWPTKRISQVFLAIFAYIQLLTWVMNFPGDLQWLLSLGCAIWLHTGWYCTQWVATGNTSSTVLLCWPNWGSPGLAKTYREGPHPDNARIEASFWEKQTHGSLKKAMTHLGKKHGQNHGKNTINIFMIFMIIRCSWISQLDKIRKKKETNKTPACAPTIPLFLNLLPGLRSWRHGPYRATRRRWLSKVRHWSSPWVPNSFLLGIFVRLWFKNIWMLFLFKNFLNSICFSETNSILG